MIEFDYSLITHVEEMDKQHIRLVALLNNVYELLKEGKKRKPLSFSKERFCLTQSIIFPKRKSLWKK
jgi:hemerythrin